MARIEVTDRVQIIKANPDQQSVLHKFGKVILIADDVNCVVALEDGGAATVTIDQLKKVD